MWRDTIIFIAGLGIGSAITYIIVEKRFRKIADEEIESVKEIFTVRKDTEENENFKLDEENSQVVSTTHDDEELVEISGGEIVDYHNIIIDQEYSTTIEDDISYNSNTEDEETRTPPYVIVPEEFATIPHFGTKTLYYYSDDILTDEIDNIINNRDDIIGEDTLDSIGVYEDDAVHVRDTYNEMDYEILQNDEPFYESLNQNGE